MLYEDVDPCGCSYSTYRRVFCIVMALVPFCIAAIVVFAIAAASDDMVIAFLALIILPCVAVMILLIIFGVLTCTANVREGPATSESGSLEAGASGVATPMDSIGTGPGLPPNTTPGDIGRPTMDPGVDVEIPAAPPVYPTDGMAAAGAPIPSGPAASMAAYPVDGVAAAGAPPPSMYSVDPAASAGAPPPAYPVDGVAGTDIPSVYSSPSYTTSAQAGLML